jgi:hypothetical protein
MLDSVNVRFALRQVVIAVASWAVITFATDVSWDGALLRSLLVTLATAAVGILTPAEPSVGVKYPELDNSDIEDW